MEVTNGFAEPEQLMSTHANLPDPGPTPFLPMPPRVYVDDEPVWEYKQLVRNLAKEDAPTEAELNALGKEGWELSGIFTDSPFLYMYFKRPGS
jgi:hypothetical protein